MSSSLTDGRILTDGRYRVVLTAAGTGFSTLDDLILTRWHRDAIADGLGLLVYLRDVDDGRTWCVGRRPIARSQTMSVRLAFASDGWPLAASISTHCQ